MCPKYHEKKRRPVRGVEVSGYAKRWDDITCMSTSHRRATGGLLSREKVSGADPNVALGNRNLMVKAEVWYLATALIFFF